MAPSAVKSFICALICLSMIIFCCMAQTFQYSRGWTNGKRSPIPADEVPTICKPFILAELINHHRLYSSLNPDYVINSQSIHVIYQHLQDLIGMPTGPIPTDAFGSNDRLERGIA